MTSSNFRRSTFLRSSASGYALLAILFMVTLLMIAVLSTAPAIKAQVRRNQEEEMVHRGVQYSRAIKKYFVKFGRYPTSLEQLEDTDHIRFLRKEYKDPMVSGGQWRLLHVGDVLMNWTNVGTPAAALASSSGISSNAGQTDGQLVSGGSPGILVSSSDTVVGIAQTSGPSAASTGGASGLTQEKSSGTIALQPSITTDSSTRAINAGAVIGVASTSEKEGLHTFNGKTQYSHWYFVYDPTLDNGALIRQPFTGKNYSYRSARNVPPAGGGNAAQPSGVSDQPSSLDQPAPSQQ